MKFSIIGTAWTNGNGSFGLKISESDRDAYFKREWDYVKVQFEINGALVEADLKTGKVSFWNKTCRELIGPAVKEYFKSVGCISWEKGKPPKFKITFVSERLFRVNKKVA